MSIVKRTACVVLLLFITTAGATARTWQIEPDGTGDAPTIQAGIDSAAAGDTVSLADGTYTGPWNRDICFYGKAIIVRSENGTPELCTIDCEGSSSEWHRGFLFTNGEGAQSRVEAVTISHGYSNEGGGVYCSAASPTLLECVFSDCWAFMGGGMSCRLGASPLLSDVTFSGCACGVNGGGLNCNGASPELIRCQFSGNTADGDGGGLNCNDASPELVLCQFSGNTAEDDGGGMACANGSNPDLVDCAFFNNMIVSVSYGEAGGGFYSADGCSVAISGTQFVENYAHEGGGIGCQDSHMIIDECTISENEAAGGGGGIYIENSDIVISDCLIENNADHSGGGALRLWDESSAVLTDCRFLNNDSENHGGVAFMRHGISATITRCRFESNSAVNFGGALIAWDHCDVSIDSCIFTANQAGVSGGGVTVWEWTVATINNSLFDRNFAGTSGGGGFCINHVEPFLSGCTFWGNDAPAGSDIAAIETSNPVLDRTILSFGQTGETVYCESTSSAVLTCSDVYGNAGGDWIGCIAGQEGVNGNFSADPLFCDPDSGDFTLDAVSPCLDAPGCGQIGAYGQGCDIYTSVADAGSQPARALGLFVSPNPSSGEVTLRYTLPSAASSSIRVYDIRGRVVRALEASGASGILTWDGRGASGERVAPGVYFAKVSDKDGSGSVRMTIIR